MLAKKNRLPVNAFPQGAKTLYRGQHLTVKTAPNALSYHRVGIVITKKTASKAVERNQLRRKVFDAFGEVARKGDELRQSLGEDLLVLIKPIKLDRDAEEKLFQELNLAKQKLRYLINPPQDERS